MYIYRSIVRNFTHSGADLATAFASMNMAIITWISTNVSTYYTTLHILYMDIVRRYDTVVIVFVILIDST